MRTLSQFLPTLVLTALFAGTGGQAAELGSKRTITLDVARGMIAAAEKKASANHWAMVVTVLDDGAHLIALDRMDGAPMGSIEVAQKKASTAVRFKSPSKDFSDGLAKGQTALMTLDILGFEGGIPVTADGQVIGAIGVSGGTAEQDGQVAAAGIEWLNAAILKK